MPTCLIIMPITTPTETYPQYNENHFQRVLNMLFVHAIRGINYDPISPIVEDNHITIHIIGQLQTTDLVLCDLSTLNPNVMFELGIRFRTGKPYAVVVDSQLKKKDIPFDIKDIPLHTYNLENPDMLAEIKRLEEYLQNIIKNRDSSKLIYNFARSMVRSSHPEYDDASLEELVEAAADCGITNIYIDRERAKTEIIKAVENAKWRLWLLGIGLYKEINLSKDTMFDMVKNKIKDIHQHKNQGIDEKESSVRILMLHALSSTGVFRTLLESKEEEVEKIIEESRRTEFSSNSYFNRLVYDNFRHAARIFEGIPEFEQVVRFYAHTPTCWMIIADNTAYFQPYTFGHSKKHITRGRSIGHLMPVFKFDAKANARPFEILKDHFNKLWLTTEYDLFHTGAHISNEANLLEEIFNARLDWFENIYGVLFHKAPGKDPEEDRREYPRRLCRSKMKTELLLDTGSEQTSCSIKEIINFSRRGLRVKLQAVDWKQGDSLKLKVTAFDPNDRNILAAIYVRDKLVNTCEGSFKIIYSHREGSDTILGLGAQRDKYNPSNKA